MRKSLILLAAVFAIVFFMLACSEATSEAKKALLEDCVYSRSIVGGINIDLKCETVLVGICKEGLPGGIEGKVVNSCDDFDFTEANKESCLFKEEIGNSSIDLTCLEVPKGKCKDLPAGEVVDTCASSLSAGN